MYMYKIIIGIGKWRNIQKVSQTIQGGTNESRVKARDAIPAEHKTNYHHQQRPGKEYKMVQSTMQCKCCHKS